MDTTEHFHGRLRRERIFNLGMALAIVIVVLVGFAPTYYLRGYFDPAPLRTLLRVHGAAFSAWIVLLAAQAAWVSAGRVDVHRRIGLAGAALAAALVVLGFATAIDAARRGWLAGHAGALTFLAVSLSDIVVFGVLAVFAMLHRNRGPVHKRLILLATIALLPPAFARWPIPLLASSPMGFFAATDLLVGAVVTYELAAYRRLQRATLLGALLIVASQPLRLVLADTRAWLALARAIVG